jgi:hypothetical protein
MTYFKVLLVYQLLGAIAGLCSIILGGTYDLSVFGLILGIGALFYLLFSTNRRHVFYSLAVLFVLQLPFLKTAAAGYAFSLGFSCFMNFRPATMQIHGFRISSFDLDFSCAPAGQPGLVGLNLVALAVLITILLTGKK